jgi:hypothetical protein
MDADEFMALIKAGKIAEAKEALEIQKAKLKFSPNKIIVKKDGSAVFKKGKKIVELGQSGEWELKN